MMRIEVLPAPPQQGSVLANLLELYAHELSDLAGLKIGEDGRFGYRPLPLYWTEPHRHPFLVRADGEIAGFVLVQQGSQITEAALVWDVAEFFILRRYRRHRVGARAAHAVWRMMEGRWEVRVMERNTAALMFWQHAIGEFTGVTAAPALVEVAGKRWRVFAFASEAGPT